MNLLSDATLPGLPADVVRPAYDRAAVTPGIVHLGVGAFHRAHQAVFVDDCLGRGETGWGIIAASLRSPDTRDALAPQDGLYTLAMRDGDKASHRVIGAISEVVVAPEDPARLLDILADPRIRLVTLTITEKGYTTDLATRTLRRDDPGVVHDLADPAHPQTALGFLVEAIARRRAAGTPPFTVLSCDNLPKNGETLHRVLTEFATLRDPALGRYVEETVACPSSMVDRIVPATIDADRAAVAAALGVEDAWPVVCEPYFQWVIEDRFPSGRPHFEASGVEFVTDVEPFEHMKLRLLNGTHTTMAAIGRLAGFSTISEAIADPTVRGLIELYWREVSPTLALGADEAHAYTRKLLARYSNRALPHRTAQIATDASQKLPQRILAPLAELRATGAPSDALAFAVAAWIRSCGGVDDRGESFALNDPGYQRWEGAPDQRTASPEAVVSAFLGLSSVFGETLPRDAHFVAELVALYDGIVKHGTLEAIRRHFAGRLPA